MFISHFSDFLKFKLDGYEGAVFIDTSDISLHLIDFKVESSLRKPTDIILVHSGTIKEIVTIYNTLKYSSFILFDDSTTNTTAISFNKLADNFYIEDKGIFRSYNNNFSFHDIIPEWKDLSNYLYNYIPKIHNVHFTFRIFPSKITDNFTHYSVDKIIYKDIQYYHINLYGNFFMSYVEMCKDIFGVQINISSLNKYIQLKYPDLNIEDGVPKLYYECLRDFRQPVWR